MGNVLDKSLFLSNLTFWGTYNQVQQTSSLWSSILPFGVGFFSFCPPTYLKNLPRERAKQGELILMGKAYQNVKETGINLAIHVNISF